MNLEFYCESHSHDPDSVLVSLERQTFLQTIAPQMISGKMQGRLLSLLSRLYKPKYILDIGTFTGYSALCLSEGLLDSGELHTIDISEDYKHIVLDISSHSPHFSKIKLHYGDGIQIIPKLNLEWDLVFLDAAKNKYLDFLDILEPIMKSNSVLIADNVLWYGKVLETIQDEETKILDQFNKRLFQSNAWDTQILCLRDGLSVSIRK